MTPQNWIKSKVQQPPVTLPIGKLVQPTRRFLLYKSNPIVDPKLYKAYGPAGMGACHFTDENNILFYLGYETISWEKFSFIEKDTKCFHKFLVGEKILYTDISIQEPENWIFFNIRIVNDESKT